MLETLRIQSAALFVFIFLLIAISVPGRSETAVISLREVRVIEIGKSGAMQPFGLAYSPAAETFLTLAPNQGKDGDGNGTMVEMFNFFGDHTGHTSVLRVAHDPLNVAFDGATDSLYFLNHASGELLVVRSDHNGFVEPGRAETVGLPQLSVGHARGMTIDPDRGRLFVLDSAARHIVSLELSRKWPVDEIMLSDDVPAGLQGIAFNPADGDLYLLHEAEQSLYRLSLSGQLIGAYELPNGVLEDPWGMVFAPSGDLTDEPERMSLYVADSTAGGQGRIVELALTEPQVLPRVAQSTAAFLVQIIDSSQFDPPSPDSAGLAYVSDAARLMMSDSEVNEMPIYEGRNVFEISLKGQLHGTFDTTAFSDEPTGVTYKPDGRRLFFSDDDHDEVYELSPGADGAYDTADDALTSFDTRAFGSHDPEGIAYEGVENQLFIVDGVNTEVYEVSAGPNGVFDGIDDRVSHFDTESLGIIDLEGIEFNPDTGTLYIVGKPADFIAEVTTGGKLVQLISISAANPRTPAGLAYGRRSNDPGFMSLYVSERGVDNDTNPEENDGKIYELGLDITASTPTATATATPSPTATATMIPATPTPPRESKENYLLYLPLVTK